MRHRLRRPREGRVKIRVASRTKVGGGVRELSLTLIKVSARQIVTVNTRLKCVTRRYITVRRRHLEYDKSTTVCSLIMYMM